MKKKLLVFGSIVIITIVVIGLVFFTKNNENNNAPKEIAVQFVNALNEKDTEKIYDLGKYENINGDKTFMTKEICLKTFDNYLNEFEPIGDFSISEGIYSENENSVRFSIYPINSTYSPQYEALFGSQNIDLILTKTDTKRYKKDGEWILQELDDLVVENYKITVPKNMKIIFQGIKVDKEYLLEEKSTEDIYQLPLVLNNETEIIFELDSFKFANKIKPNSSGYKFSEDNIPTEFKDDLQDVAASFLEILVNGVIENKSWDEIRNNLNLKAVRQNTLKNIYGDNYNKQNIEDSLKEIKDSYLWGDKDNNELDSSNSLLVQYLENYFNTEDAKASTTNDEVKDLKKLYEIEREGLLKIDKSKKDTVVALKNCIVLPEDYRIENLSINNQDYIYLKTRLRLNYQAFSNDNWWDRSNCIYYTFLFKLDKENGIELVNIDDILFPSMVYLIRHDDNVIENK